MKIASSKMTVRLVENDYLLINFLSVYGQMRLEDAKYLYSTKSKYIYERMSKLALSGILNKNKTMISLAKKGRDVGQVTLGIQEFTEPAYIETKLARQIAASNIAAYLHSRGYDVITDLSKSAKLIHKRFIPAQRMRLRYLEKQRQKDNIVNNVTIDSGSRFLGLLISEGGTYAIYKITGENKVSWLNSVENSILNIEINDKKIDGLIILTKSKKTLELLTKLINGDKSSNQKRLNTISPNVIKAISSYAENTYLQEKIIENAKQENLKMAETYQIVSVISEEIGNTYIFDVLQTPNWKKVLLKNILNEKEILPPRFRMCDCYYKGFNITVMVHNDLLNLRALRAKIELENSTNFFEKEKFAIICNKDSEDFYERELPGAQRITVNMCD